MTFFQFFIFPQKKVMLIFNLEIRKFCTRFPKLIVVPVYEMRFGIVRYDHLTSFETLAHTFPMFLPSQLSAWSSQDFSKFAIANFFERTLKKNRYGEFSKTCVFRGTSYGYLRWKEHWKSVAQTFKRSQIIISNNSTLHFIQRNRSEFRKLCWLISTTFAYKNL